MVTPPSSPRIAVCWFTTTVIWILTLLLVESGVKLDKDRFPSEGKQANSTCAPYLLSSVFVYVSTVWPVSVLAQRNSEPTDRWAG